MNFATLRLVVLGIIFAWAQVCCCQAGAAMGAAKAAIWGSSAPHAAVCCGGCPVPMDPLEAEGTREPGAPCHDHGDCAGCLPRLAWMPEGPTEVAADLLGAMAPAAVFVDPPAMREQWRAKGPQRLDFPEASTLVRLHCALIV